MADESAIRTVRLDGETFFELDRYIHYGSKMVQGGRKSQQDSMFAGIDGEYFLGVICDGMGGMNGGNRPVPWQFRCWQNSFMKTAWKIFRSF